MTTSTSGPLVTTPTAASPTARAAPADRSAALALKIVFLASGVVFAIQFRREPWLEAIWDVPWAVAVGTAGAFAFWRLGRQDRGGVVMPAALWLSAFLAHLDQRCLPGHSFSLWAPVVAAVSTTALVAALRPTWRSIGMLAVVAAASACLGATLNARLAFTVTDRWTAVLGAGALLVASLTARRRHLAAAFALATTLVLHLAVQRTQFGRCWEYAFIARPGESLSPGARVSVLLCASLAAGVAVARPAAREWPRDFGARLVVGCQRHPWAVSACVAAVLGALACPWIWPWKDTVPWYGIDDTTRLSLFVVGVAFLFEVGRAGRSAFDGLAPVLAACLVAPLLALGVDGPFASGFLNYRVDGPWLALAACGTPILTGLLASRVSRRHRDPRGFVVAGVLVTLLFVAALKLPPERLASWEPLPWILVLSIAFQVAVRSGVSSGHIVLVAAAVGFVDFVHHAHRGSFLWHRCSQETAPIELAVRPATWLVAGLLVVAARRCRSMTAVPLDHPVVADFGRR